MRTQLRLHEALYWLTLGTLLQRQEPEGPVALQVELDSLFVWVDDAGCKGHDGREEQLCG